MGWTAMITTGPVLIFIAAETDSPNGWELWPLASERFTRGTWMSRVSDMVIIHEINIKTNNLLCTCTGPGIACASVQIFPEPEMEGMPMGA